MAETPPSKTQTRAFGGLEAFGPLGMLLGPLFVALVRLYDQSYRSTPPPGRPEFSTP